MNAIPAQITLDVLLVDDDPEALAQYRQTLPDNMLGHSVYWDTCGSFEQVSGLLLRRRFDLVVTDVYRNRNGVQKGMAEADNAAREILDEIRRLRFCPVVLFSDGPAPEFLLTEPFVRFVDKSGPDFRKSIETHFAWFLQTGIVQGVRQLHADLDRATGSYIWDFIEKRWGELSALDGFNTDVLRRLVRRRAATQLSRLEEDSNLRDRDSSDAFDYYTYPTPEGPLLLGEILRHKESGEFHVVLTPHCYLVARSSKVLGAPSAPKADFVLLARCVSAAGVIAAEDRPKQDRAIRIPAEIGKPSGRFCYLPAFLDIPDVYCDLLQLNSVAAASVADSYHRIAVIDPPFAEGIQASMTKLYSSVGLRDLRPEDFGRLFPPKIKGK